MTKEVKWFLLGVCLGLAPLVVPATWYFTSGWIKQRKAVKQTKLEIHLLETLVNRKRK